MEYGAVFNHHKSNVSCKSNCNRTKNSFKDSELCNLYASRRKLESAGNYSNNCIANSTIATARTTLNPNQARRSDSRCTA